MEKSWIENIGVQPASDDVMVEVILGSGARCIRKARDFIWTRSADWIGDSSDNDVLRWRLVQEESPLDAVDDKFTPEPGEKFMLRRGLWECIAVGDDYVFARSEGGTEDLIELCAPMAPWVDPEEAATEAALDAMYGAMCRGSIGLIDPELPKRIIDLIKNGNIPHVKFEA